MSYLPSKRNLENIVLHYEDSEMAQAMPALYELLCHAKREGRFRAGARLTFFCESGSLKASIWDPDTSQVWFATLDGSEGLVAQVESMLQNGQGEWRVKRDQTRR